MPVVFDHDDAQVTVIAGQPVHPDNTVILHKGNDANISGAIHSFWQWCIRTNTHVLLIKHHATAERGYIYIDDYAAISFINDIIVDDRDAKNPAPPTATRVRQTKEAADTAHALDSTSPSSDKLTFASAIPDGDKTFQKNKYKITEAKASLLTSLGHIFKAADWCCYFLT